MTEEKASVGEPKVAIIILNWNREEDILECLASLQRSSYENYEIIVVDNDSTDGSAERIKQKFLEIVLIKNRENLGFCGGNNVGIRYALQSEVDYIFLLNDDTIVEPGMLNKLVRVMEENPEIGAVGPTIYFHNQPNVIQSVGAKIDFKTGKTLLIRQRYSASSKIIKEVDYVSGCALMTRKEIVEKIGFLDERFFCYYEETDYCMRIRKIGYEIACVSYASLWHKSEGRKNFLIYLYFYIRNVPLFMVKHAEKRGLVKFFAYYYPVWTVVYSTWYAIKRRKKNEIIVIVLGFLDFIFLRFGKGSFDTVLKLLTESQKSPRPIKRD